MLVADAMEIPGNLGTLIRTLDACAADCLVLTSKRTRLTHPKVLRSSQGMNMKVPLVEFAEIGDAIGWLPPGPFTVYLADTDDSISYRQADFGGRTALVRRQRAVRHLAALGRLLADFVDQVLTGNLLEVHRRHDAAQASSECNQVVRLGWWLGHGEFLPGSLARHWLTRRREPIAGINPEHASSSLVEVLGRCGFDLIFIDCEPGGPGIERVADMARAARAAGTVSVPALEHGPGSDQALSGMWHRRIDPARDRERGTNRKHPCRHRRGKSARRGEPLILILLIVVTGVANAADILRADGVDAIQVGPGDLAVSMGLPRYGDHQQVTEAMFELYGLARRLGSLPVDHRAASGSRPWPMQEGIS